jgi:hypothetical protein
MRPSCHAHQTDGQEAVMDADELYQASIKATDYSATTLVLQAIFLLLREIRESQNTPFHRVAG